MMFGTRDGRWFGRWAVAAVAAVLCAGRLATTPSAAQTTPPSPAPVITPLGIGSSAAPDSGQPQDAPRRRRQMPGGAAAPFFDLPDTALPFAPQIGTIPGLAAPGASPQVINPNMLVDRTPVALDARFVVNGQAIRDGMHWRIFADRPEANGTFAMVTESRDAAPVFALRPGAYVVHAAFGLVTQAQRVEVGSDPLRRTMVMNAGALRLVGKIGNRTLPRTALNFDLFAGGLFEGGEPRLIRRQAPAEELITLPEGTYHVVSLYGDANAIIRADVRIRSGRLTDAVVHHRAATISLRLVQGRPGGEPVINVSWSVLTPGGDVIKESIGAFPQVILQEGEYLAIARHDGRVFNRRFQVEAGKDENIDVVAR